jgi:hypothetical protein
MGLREEMNDDFDLALVPFLERKIPSSHHSGRKAKRRSKK